MCGRFVLKRPLHEYVEEFSIATVLIDGLSASWNVAPTQPIYVVVEEHGDRSLEVYRWGLIPSWAKDARPFHINARMETVDEKPTFRSSLQRRRCLVPADGFYEWTDGPQGRQPHFVEREGGGFAFAGLWSKWTDPATGEEVRSATIITAPASPAIASIHDRMPLHLPEDSWQEWLDQAQTDGAAAKQLLESAAGGPPLRHREVSMRVNSVANNDASLLD